MYGRCCICGEYVDKEGMSKRPGHFAVQWHHGCYRRKYGISAEEYVRMENEELQTELSAEQAEELEAIKPKRTITDKETGMKLTNTTAFISMNHEDGYRATYTKGYSFEVEHDGEKRTLFVHKAPKKGWNVSDPLSGYMLLGSFRTRKEALESITPTVVKAFVTHTGKYEYRAKCRLLQTLKDRGSAMPKAQHAKLLKKYEKEEWAKVEEKFEKAAMEKAGADVKATVMEPKRKKEPEIKVTRAAIIPTEHGVEAVPIDEDKAIEITLEYMKAWCREREGVTATQNNKKGKFSPKCQIKVSGENTIAYRKELKALGFKWGHSIKAWWYKPQVA